MVLLPSLSLPAASQTAHTAVAEGSQGRTCQREEGAPQIRNSEAHEAIRALEQECERDQGGAERIETGI